MVIEKLCDVVKLPITDIRDKNIEGATFCSTPKGYDGYNIHIISWDMDEKIEVGDWFVDKRDHRNVFLCKGVHEDEYNNKTIFSDTYLFQKNLCSKVIASTQLNINVPRIPDSFKKEFCEKNGEIEQVMVRYESHCKRDGAINKVCRTCGKFSFVPVLNFDAAIDKDGKPYFKQLITLKPTQSQWTKDEVEKKIWAFAREHGIHFRKTKKWIDKSF